MPHETILNLALNGEELKAIILRDMQRLLDNECMLMQNVAFPRVAYTVTLKLHMENPFYPQSGVSLNSRPPSRQELEKSPQSVSLESPPLTNTTNGEVGASTLTREITSGNEERLRNAMSIPCLVPQQDGTKAQESIRYPEGSFPELGEGNVKIEDTTAQAKVDWSILEKPQDILIEEPKP